MSDWDIKEACRLSIEALEEERQLEHADCNAEITKLTQERDEWKREAFAAAQLLHLFRERHTFTFRETEQGKEYARAVSRELGE